MANYKKESKIQLKEILSNLKKFGYKCFTVDGSEHYGTYGFMITPSDNVLYIQYSNVAGWTFSLEYNISKECGTGCQCLENPVSEVTLEIVKQAEIEGLQFARKLKAPLYKNSDEWIKKYYKPKSLVLV